MRKCILGTTCLYQHTDGITMIKSCLNGAAEYPCISNDDRIRDQWKANNFAVSNETTNPMSASEIRDILDKMIVENAPVIPKDLQCEECGYEFCDGDEIFHLYQSVYCENCYDRVKQDDPYESESYD